MTPPSQNIQNVTQELELLKAEHDKMMALAVYVGMSKDEAKTYDQRARRIVELYETLLALKSATQS